MKKCSKCKKIKELPDFYKSRNTKDGYDVICKVCTKLIHRSPRVGHIGNSGKKIIRGQVCYM